MKWIIGHKLKHLVSHCNIQDTEVHLTLYSRMLSEFQNLIMSELVLLWVAVVPALSLYSLMTRFMRVG